jgi:type VI secretion system secreted protein Hcp
MSACHPPRKEQNRASQITKLNDYCIKPNHMKRILGKLFGALGLAAVLVSLSAQAAVDMFLDIPGIPGESKDQTHKDQVDVLAWSWGMSNSGTTHIGGGGGAGKVNIQDLSLTKYVDKASPELMKRCANGSLLTKVTLFVRKVGANPIEYIKIELTEVLVSAVSTGGSGGEDRLTENVTLNFAKVKFDYVPAKPDGSPDTAITFTWDIPLNIP